MERLPSFSLNKGEKFYTFHEYKTDPKTVRHLIDTAPESVISDEKFQRRVIDTVFFCIDSGQVDVSDLISIIGGLSARGVTEADISLKIREKVLEYLRYVGDIEKFEKAKNTFRLILEDAITNESDAFGEKLLERIFYKDESDDLDIKAYLSTLRRILPMAFNEEHVSRFFEKHIQRRLDYYCSGVEDEVKNVKKWWGYLVHIPEIHTFLPQGESEIIAAIKKRCIYVALNSDKTWREISGVSIEEIGLGEEVTSAILEYIEADTPLVDHSKLQKLLAFFDLPYLTLRTKKQREDACRILSQIDLLSDIGPRVELLTYMHLYGVDGSMMVTSDLLRERFVKIIVANDLSGSEQVVADYDRIVDELQLGESEQQLLGCDVGFQLLKRGEYGSAITLHRSLGLSYLPDQRGVERNDDMQYRVRKFIDNEFRSDNSFSTNLSNLELFRSLALIPKDVFLSEMVIPSIVDFQSSAGNISTLYDNIKIYRGTDPVTDSHISNLVQAMSRSDEVRNLMARATIHRLSEDTADYVFKDIAKMAEMRLLPESYIYSDAREIALQTFLNSLTEGRYRDIIADLFKIGEADISLEQFQEKVKFGIARRLNITYAEIDYSGVSFAPHDRVSNANRFAERCGLGGENLREAIKMGLLRSVRHDEFDTFLALVAESNIPLAEIVHDEKFITAIDKALIHQLEHNPVSALQYVKVFQLENNLASVHSSLLHAFYKNPSSIDKIIEIFPSKIISRSFGEMAISGITDGKIIPIEYALLINNHFAPPVDAMLYRSEKIFGSFVDWKSYDYLQQLLIDKILPDELREMGVTRVGEAGVEQLNNLLHDFSRRITRDEVTSEELGNSTLLLSYYMDKTRVKVTQWGRIDPGTVVERMRWSEVYHREHPDSSFADRYTKSEVFKIGTTKELKEFAFDEDFLNRYRSLTKTILKAANDCNPLSMPLSKRIEDLSSEKDSLVGFLIAKLDEEPSEGLLEKAQKVAKRQGVEESVALANMIEIRNTQLRESIEVLKHMSLRSLADVQGNFVTLAKYKELHPLLLETIFTFALMQREHRGEVGNPDDNGLSTDAMRLLGGHTPTLDSVTWTLNFIDHIVNKEIMAKYFTDKRAADALRRIASTVVLEKQLPKMIETNNVAKIIEANNVAKISMQFLPTRGALLEFSGQIGDACWANKYRCIAEQFPNITAVVMIEKPDSMYEKLAGSTMLIETIAADGEPLLVIRGLNPIENVINKLQVEDFYNTFTTWANEQAVKMGRKLAVVIDGHSGGSATNRPVLFQYLSSKRQDLKKVSLASRNDTTFNAYDITDKVYLVYST